MASLTTLYGTGGGRIPTASGSIALSAQDLAHCIATMPTETCRAMHIAARTGDLPTAQRLLREAAERYVAAAPAPHARYKAPC
jgi:hypothetical protein